MSKSQTKWTIKFYPDIRKNSKNDNAEKSMPLNMAVSFGRNKRLMFYTREHAKRSDFLPDYLARVEKDPFFFRPLKPQIAGSTEKNGRLEALAKEALRLIMSADNASTPIIITVTYLRNNLKYLIDGAPPDKESDQFYLADLEDKYLQYSFQQKSANSTRNDKQFITKLEAFLTKRKLHNITLDAIDQSLADDFHSYLLRLKLLNNTVVKHLRGFSTFLNWCKRKGYIVNEIKFQVKENIPEIIYLNEEELDLVESVELENPTLEWVRDLFVFGCYTAMRVSDITKLKKTDYYDEMVHNFEKKGHKTTSNAIPIIEGALKVVEKYKDFPGEYLLPHKTEQCYNKFLKQLLKKAKINQSVKIAEQRGGKIEELTFLKYQLASSHLARKTFITKAMVNGMPEPVIKSITGHSKNSRAITRYYDIADIEKLKAMKKYFGKKNKEPLEEQISET